MAASEARCPHCQARFMIPAAQLGKPARCGRCQQTFTPTAPPPAPPPVAAAPPPPPRPVLRPVAVAAAVPPVEPPRPRADDEDEPAGRPPRKKPRGKRPAERSGLHPGVIAGIAAGGGVLLLGVAGLVAYLAWPSSPEPANPRIVAAGPVTPAVTAPNPPANSSASRPASPIAPALPGPGGVNNPSTSAPPPAPSDGADAAANTVRRVKRSTVYIRCEMGRGVLATGSGFFAGPPGYIMTNAHVIGLGPEKLELPRRVQVVVDSGETTQREFEARLVGVDSEEDLALLWINGKDLPAPLSLGKSADLVETQDVFIFGYPLGEALGLNISVNKTTVSSLRKRPDGTMDVVQVAGGMHPGNSGGPVTDKAGAVIGVSVAVIRGTLINFAIPAEIASKFLKDQIASGGKIDLGRGIPPVSTKGKGRGR